MLGKKEIDMVKEVGYIQMGDGHIILESKLEITEIEVETQ